MMDESVFLNHILEQTELIMDILSQITWDEFEASKIYQHTFVRAMEIIGEASKHISDETRLKYPMIHFKEMAGLRDRLIHGYFTVDPIRVFEIAENDIPEVNRQLKAILKKSV